MSVVAKFYVSEITRYAGHSSCTKVVLQVVSRHPENKSWAASTPTGRLEMTVLNEVAAEQFEPGAEYLIRFEKADSQHVVHDRRP